LFLICTAENILKTYRNRIIVRYFSRRTSQRIYYSKSTFLKTHVGLSYVYVGLKSCGLESLSPCSSTIKRFRMEKSISNCPQCREPYSSSCKL